MFMDGASREFKDKSLYSSLSMQDFIMHHQAVVNHAKAAIRNEAKKIMQSSSDDLGSNSLTVITTVTATTAHDHP